MMKRVIYLASDHAGFLLKEKIKSHLSKRDIQFEDLGAFSPKASDYPDFIIPAVKKAVKNNSSAIALGGTGQGEAIAANKVKGARAIVIYSYNAKIIKLSKQHNNANVLSLGARFLTTNEALEAIDLWLQTPFSKEKRHIRRLRKIEKIENSRNRKP